MATFEAPNYVIGNSSSITASLSSVLTTLDQALQALQPAPNATTVQFTDTIILTDGTTTNTLDKTGYTTKNSVQNSTHYLNFSDSSATGIGAIQKTAGISCNPSTSTLTATTFVGALTGTASSATTATNITTTSDNTSGTYYIPFSKTSAGTSTALYLDDTTGPLSYNPSTSNLSASIFTGSVNITNALNTYTFVSTTLTLDFSTLTFKNFYNSTSITTAITQSAISFSNAVSGGSYMVYITTGVGGSFTFNTGISGVKTTFASAFTIPASSVGVMSIYYINSVYIVGINILT